MEDAQIQRQHEQYKYIEPDPKPDGVSSHILRFHSTRPTDFIPCLADVGAKLAIPPIRSY